MKHGKCKKYNLTKTKHAQQNKCYRVAFWKAHFYILANAHVLGSWSHWGSADYLDYLGILLVITFFCVCFFLNVTRGKGKGNTPFHPNQDSLSPPGKEYMSFWLIFSWPDHCHFKEHHAPKVNKI